MAHGITARDSLMVVRHPAWHGLGVVLDHTPRTLDEALAAAGLTWSVAKHPCTALTAARSTASTPPCARTPTRSSASSPTTTSSCRTATASPSWPTCWAPSSSSRPRARCGAGGRSSSRPSCPTTSRSAATRSAPTSCSRRGTRAPAPIRAMTTPVRAVCNNTVRLALERARAVYRVRHVGDPTGQLHEARAVLGLTVDYYRQFQRLGDRWHCSR